MWRGLFRIRSNRCYICKKGIVSNLLEIAEGTQNAFVVEGFHIDDEGDYRPGMQAVKELDIASPLREVGLTKRKSANCPEIWSRCPVNKPSSACLSRVLPMENRLPGKN